MQPLRHSCRQWRCVDVALHVCHAGARAQAAGAAHSCRQAQAAAHLRSGSAGRGAGCLTVWGKVTCSYQASQATRGSHPCAWMVPILFDQRLMAFNRLLMRAAPWWTPAGSCSARLCSCCSSALTRTATAMWTQVSVTQHADTPNSAHVSAAAHGAVEAKHSEHSAQRSMLRCMYLTPSHYHSFLEPS